MLYLFLLFPSYYITYYSLSDLFRSLCHCSSIMVSLPASAVVDTTDTQSLGFGDRLTVKDVLAWRAKNPAMGGGIATFVSSDMFKSLVSTMPIFLRVNKV